MADKALPAGTSGKPDTYLAGGWREADGSLRKPLGGLEAFAVALRFQGGEVPPQWPAAVLEALRQTLPDTQGPVQERIALALEDSLNLVQAMLGDESPDTLDEWLGECAAHIDDDDDLAAFLAHFEAVVRQYGALAAAITGDPTAT